VKTHVKLSYIYRNYLTRKREAGIALRVIGEEQEEEEIEIGVVRIRRGGGQGRRINKNNYEVSKVT
jgi:hypothetical protein